METRPVLRDFSYNQPSLIESFTLEKVLLSPVINQDKNHKIPKHNIILINRIYEFLSHLIVKLTQMVRYEFFLFCTDEINQKKFAEWSEWSHLLPTRMKRLTNINIANHPEEVSKKEQAAISKQLKNAYKIVRALLHSCYQKEDMPTLFAKNPQDFECKDHDLFRFYKNAYIIRRDVNSTQEKYKLHLAIHLDEYRSYLSPLLEILKKSLENNTIYEFKVINTEVMPTTLMKDKISNGTTLQSRRCYNNPVIIYIPEKCDYRALAELCIHLEKVLAFVATDSQSLSPADIVLSSHVSFRQETLGSYVKIAEKTSLLFDRLRNEGMNSTPYISLTGAINNYKNTLETELRQFKDEIDAFYLNTRGPITLFKEIPEKISKLKHLFHIGFNTNKEHHLNSLLRILVSCNKILNEDSRKKLNSNEQTQGLQNEQTQGLQMLSPDKVLCNKWAKQCDYLLEVNYLPQNSNLNLKCV